MNGSVLDEVGRWVVFVGGDHTQLCSTRQSKCQVKYVVKAAKCRPVVVISQASLRVCSDAL